MPLITWKRGEFHQLSPHFNSTEIQCQCEQCPEQQIESELLDRLELIRAQFPDGIQITSGYRCPSHQAEILHSGMYETVQNSQHVLGRAVDCRPVKLGVMHQFEAEAAKHFKAIGIASTFLHLDLRDDKVRRWTYS
jgi:uncharacterized protein YcbK (DUF882 family)